MSLRQYQKGTNPKLEINEYGNEQGIDPRQVSLGVFDDDIIKSPIKAIRANCIDCSGGQSKEVKFCTATDCPLWPFRMGKNIFWGN